MQTEQLLEHIDDVIADWEVGPDAVRFNAPPEARLQPAWWALPDWLWDALAEQLQLIIDALPDIEMVICALHDHARCPNCNPMANPPKLPIDGAEYSRRRKARRRT